MTGFQTSGRPAHRRPSRRVRRNRTVAAVVAVTVAAVVIPVATLQRTPSSGHPSKHVVTTTPTRPGKRPVVIPAVKADLLPWRLAAPLSRMVVEPSSGSNLTVLGGYEGGVSAAGVYALDTADGKLTLVGNLALPTHDAAGALIDGRDVLFGGGDTVSDGVVQAFAPTAGEPTAATIGQLPDARSDCVAVSIGRVAYVVGGYDGLSGDAAVLDTTDGMTFRTAATLPVPVRYPAVSTIDGKIYVFGGAAVGGPDNGRPVGEIQVINPSTGSAQVIGTMPEALEGASAVTIQGHVYIAGGDSASTGTTTPNSSSPTIWAFDAVTDRMLRAGSLRVAVSYAGIAVTGTAAWVVGGETNGVATSAVQMFAPDPGLGAAGGPG